MQNVGEQTRSIMVFSEVAYSLLVKTCFHIKVPLDVSYLGMKLNH